jgi:hypothetical protein
VAPPRRRRFALVAAILLATLGLVAPGSDAAPTPSGAQAKNKQPKPPPRVGVFKVAIPQPVPDRAPGDTAFVGVLDSHINVGRRYKGREISDVDVGLSVLGPAGALEEVELYLRSPNGATVFLAGDHAGQGSTSYGTGDCTTGPTTFTDETENFISDGAPPATFPGTVFAPWASIVQTDGFPLSIVDGGKAMGTWTLRVVDDTAGNQFALNCWQITLRTRPASQ